MSASPPEVGRPGAVPRRPRVAVVIGSGSVKCAAAIGLLKVLQREGIGIDLLVGCSGGSIYAALIALGYEPARTEEMTRKLWTKELTSRRNRVAFLRAFLPFVPFHERFGLVSDRLIMDRLRTAFGDATFEQARIPLFLTATDFHNGEQVVFAKGAIVDALRASIASPYVFEPWPVDDRGFESPYQSKVTSLLRFAFQLSSITSNNLLRANYSFHNLAHHHEIIPIVPQFKERVGLFDTHKIPYVIEEGERAAQEKLPYIRRLLAATDA